MSSPTVTIRLVKSNLISIEYEVGYGKSLHLSHPLNRYGSDFLKIIVGFGVLVQLHTPIHCYIL